MSKLKSHEYVIFFHAVFWAQRMAGQVAKDLFGLAMLAVVLVILPGCAHAETVYGLHVGSQHFPAREFNNSNPGLYVRAADWQVGMYHNSYRDTTAYVARAWPLGNGFELMLGGATGYRKAGAGVVAPMAGITYAVPIRILGLQPRLFAAPPTPKSSGLLHLALEF